VSTYTSSIEFDNLYLSPSIGLCLLDIQSQRRQVGIRLHAQTRSPINGLPEVGLIAEIAEIAKVRILSFLGHHKKDHAQATTF
jgi:hypothetical protein